ncbi:hypothetical protein JEQ12_000146 [Ovis aries]|uniref:Uncharacterized protein n=1 Tax=Ovis aries TaxID=9940 RepID=A0A836AF21_SHEEP|nr:hypothetical protein JEQ12_000146 [Ovis aries]
MNDFCVSEALLIWVNGATTETDWSNVKLLGDLKERRERGGKKILGVETGGREEPDPDSIASAAELGGEDARTRRLIEQKEILSFSRWYSHEAGTFHYRMAQLRKWAMQLVTTASEFELRALRSPCPKQPPSQTLQLQPPPLTWSPPTLAG